jgi:hypothetical protein
MQGTGAKIIEAQQAKICKNYKKRQAKFTENECSHFFEKNMQNKSTTVNNSASKSTEISDKAGTSECHCTK